MHWLVELIMYVFLLAAAIVALNVKDLLAAAVTTTAFSFVIAIAFVAMGAVDVGFTEAVIGAGLVGVFFIVFILKTSRRTLD
ncbi:MAG: hydrogenase subunit MbhD domain-containing protein [Oceanipulchritudo sp.]